MAEASALKRILRPLFGTFALAFVIYAAIDIWSSWDSAAVRLSPWYLVASIVSAGAAMVFQMVAWRVLIREMSGRTMPRRLSARLYLDSQMARYTPGKVGLPVVRVAGAQDVGIEPKVMGSALLIEVVSWAATGSIVGGAVLFFVPDSDRVARQLSQGALVVSVGAFVGLVVALVVDRRRLPSTIRKLWGDSGSGPLVPWQLPALHLLHFALWILTGALVCLCVGGGLGASVAAGGLLCLAIVAGFVALLAPAGAGVREAVMVAGLSPFLGPSASVAVGILSRVASLVSDVLLWLWFRFRASERGLSKS